MTNRVLDEAAGESGMSPLECPPPRSIYDVKKANFLQSKLFGIKLNGMCERIKQRQEAEARLASIEAHKRMMAKRMVTGLDREVRARMLKAKKQNDE